MQYKAVNKKKKRCLRCGKAISHYHYLVTAQKSVMSARMTDCVTSASKAGR